MLYNMLGAVMRSFGETKMPLYALVVSYIINSVLNIVFIINGGGVIGIAASTIIAQAISLAYICWFNSEKNSRWQFQSVVSLF
ncbi:polysaccharide biosynthesis C-terminal domain-containing protein [Ihubacter sp. rT4E-8]|uniref:polysaccharide biosynthesis C-terminal domain-containing protein n=1 Tax=Ihubacter sp. rT4E-8 TaxID=3242369 RepID=UPI003CEF133E